MLGNLIGEALRGNPEADASRQAEAARAAELQRQALQRRQAEQQRKKAQEGEQPAEHLAQIVPDDAWGVLIACFNTCVLRTVWRQRLQDSLNLRSKRRHMIARCRVDDIPIDAKIVVNKNVSHPCDLSPGNLRMLVFDGFGKTPDCLTNDLQVPQDM